MAIRVEPATLPEQARRQLANLTERFGVRASAPVEIRAAGALPAAGAVLTRTYPTPLPTGARAAFAYLDAQVGGWRVVPSTLSVDRRTLTATVHHFSTWTDISGWATSKLGEFFDVRVSKPTCNGKDPAWVDSVVFLDDRNSALLWCSGHDSAHPDRLVIKVRVNRGYGVGLTTDVRPLWTWNSFVDRDAADIARELWSDYSKTLAQYVSFLSTGGQLVPGGSEVDFGFTENQVRTAERKGVALVTAANPDPTELALNIVIKELADGVTNRSAAYVLGILTIAHCGSAVVKAGSNWSRLAGALTECIVDGRNILARQLAGYLAEHDPTLSPKAAATKAVGLTRKLKLITAAGIAFQAVEYWSDVTLPEAARTISVFPTVLRSTKKVVLAPVRTDGTAAPGYSVSDMAETVDCDPPTPSPVSYSAGVYACSPTAASADVCWADATPQHVLCLYSPWDRSLVRLSTDTPLSPVRAVGEPDPHGLELDDGDHCVIRNGGSWGVPDSHPDYVGYYSCQKNTAVWGAEAGIDTSTPTWTVQVGDETGPLVRRTVRTAYYVTTK